jgi:uncharacterized protein YjbI with pentapeptide repeats
MADQQQLDLFRQGSEHWNSWQKKHPGIQTDLSEANLSGLKLIRVNLNGANLGGANLSGANLKDASLRSASLRNADLNYAFMSEAKLTHANLRNANLSHATLSYTDLSFANFIGANLMFTDLSSTYLIHTNFSRADLMRTDFSSAALIHADFSHAKVNRTIFGDIDLSTAKGLDLVHHQGPAHITMSTLSRSQGNIPEVFLRGAGVPEPFIEYMAALTKQSIEYYTCFISYSSKDQKFAERIYADLQSKGVRCWFAPEDMKTGDKIRYRIDESIRLYDKLLLILSEASVTSQWVEHEVETAIGKELEGKPNVLFPVRLDDAVMESKGGWASHIRLTRHITDFSHWKDHDQYQQAFAPLLRDLKAESSKQNLQSQRSERRG